MHVEDMETPELRLVKKDDPEAYNFNTPQYSAHKLPKEVGTTRIVPAFYLEGDANEITQVVDVGMGGAQSIQEFAQRWREIVNSMEDT